ncbi:hypothetical protein NQ317_000291 [Molorchus minor]|uniref:Uncharacterized protein n=1 Tax=Molorchus minor TaxID=1323400 RepID=A0ABQ9JAZ9_9CUCU|nr:hypothetical protein NQ317_000291 [Molorchus minor]
MKNSSGLVSLYITSCEKDIPAKVTLSQLKAAMPNLEPASFVETTYGLIINLANDKDIRKILKLDLAKIFGKPVQVVPLFSGQFKKIVTFRDVPWCIRNEELEICLKKQGINFGKLSREKAVIYVEVADFPNFQRLREEGINFYDSVVFRAAEDIGLNDEVTYNADNIIQCYR